MSKGQKQRRNVIIFCAIWAIFGVINQAMYYEEPAPSVYWNNKRVASMEVNRKMQVEVQNFCKALSLEYTIDGNQLIVGNKAQQVIQLNRLSPTNQYSTSPIRQVPLEALCQAMGIPYEWDSSQHLIKLGSWNEQAAEIPVLMYHHILPQADITGIFQDNNIVVSLEDFRAQMTYLRDNGYHTVSLRQLERYVAGEELLPDKSVVITFDDGYLSNYIYAYPVLKELGFKGVIFLLTGFIENAPQTFSPAAVQYLSWPEIEEMADVFEFASHTHDMHTLNVSGKGRLSEASYDQITADLKASRQLLKHTRYFSYPYGHYSALALDTLKRQGITMAFTVNEGSVKIGDDPMKLNRWDVFRHSGSIEAFAAILAPEQQ